MPPLVKSLIQERPKSKRLYEKMCRLIPGGVNSPVRSFPGLQQTPLILASAQGDLIYDIDDNAYIDFCASWGPLIHGHAHPLIHQAIQAQLAKGSSYGISCEPEAALAELITSAIPSIEKIRFVSSGTEATMSAVRLARAFTQRSYILKFHGNYHGHADQFLLQAGSGVTNLSATSSSAGIPPAMVAHTLSLPYNDCESFKQALRNPQIAEQLGAVILEPIAGNMGVVPATHEFLKLLREETRRLGALLIFDEIITGFRVGFEGAQGLYNITPDLTCLGKIMGGGFPAAAFGGRSEIMDLLAPLGPVYQAGTLSGNPIAMVAGYTTLKLCQAEGFYDNLKAKTDQLTVPIQAFIEAHNLSACLQQVGSMFTLFLGKKRVSNGEEAKQLNTALFSQFFTYMLERGIYIPPAPQEAWFISSAHLPEHLAYTRDTILEFLQR